MKRAALWGVAAVAVSLVAGCSTEGSDGSTSEVPGVDLDGLGIEQYMEYSGWGNDAWYPSQSYSEFDPWTISGGATLTRLAGTTATSVSWSVCLLQLTSTPCSNDGECSAVYAPYGGPKTCVAPDHVGQKYCAFRPGPGSSVCVGTTVNGNNPVGPGSYATPAIEATASANYISSACFGFCTTVNRSASPKKMGACTVDPLPGASWCVDTDCDGTADDCQEIAP